MAAALRFIAQKNIFPRVYHNFRGLHQAKSGKGSVSRNVLSLFQRNKAKNGQLPVSVPSRHISTSSSLNTYYVKYLHLKKWGRRDKKRRRKFKKFEVTRNALRMIKKSDILPSGVRAKAAEDMEKLPLNSSITRIRNRCVLTDRGRGIVGRFKVSRIMFRYYAEKGLIAGVQKSQW